MAKKIVITTNPKKADPATKPQLEQPAAGITPRRQMLRTTDLKRPEDPPNLNELGGVRTSAIDDKNFIGSQATAEELRDLRARIEARQAPPAQAPDDPQVVLVCDNVRCRRWNSYSAKDAARNVGRSCIDCNFKNTKDGGMLRLATPVQTEMFWTDKKRREEIWKVRVKQQREIEAERSRLGLGLVGYLSIENDPSIKRNR